MERAQEEVSDIYEEEKRGRQKLLSEVLQTASPSQLFAFRDQIRQNIWKNKNVLSAVEYRNLIEAYRMINNRDFDQRKLCEHLKDDQIVNIMCLYK